MILKLFLRSIFQKWFSKSCFSKTSFFWHHPKIIVFNDYNNTKLIIYFIFVLIHIHSFEIFSFCVSWFEFMRSLIHQKMTEKLYFMKKINDVKIWINKSKFNNWMFLFNFYLFLFYFLFIFCNENEKWKTNENSLNNIF